MINFFDLGQHKGNVTEMFLNIINDLSIKKYHIYGFEASEVWYKYSFNRFENNPNITCLHKAITKSNKILKLYKSSGITGDSIFSSKSNVDPKVYQEVHGIQFSNWFRKHISPNDINVVKTNIEGAEYHFFNDIIDNNIYKDINIFCGTINDPKKIKSLQSKLDSFYQKILNHHIEVHYFSDIYMHKNVDLKNMIKQILKNQ